MWLQTQKTDVHCTNKLRECSERKNVVDCRTKPTKSEGVQGIFGWERIGDDQQEGIRSEEIEKVRKASR